MGCSENAECGVSPHSAFSEQPWKVRCVKNVECGKCGVWKMRSVEDECRKYGVWKIRSVENAE